MMDFGEFVHTGKGTLAGRYLRMFWQPVCCSYELAAGRALPVRILGEDFTVYRGESGNPYLVGPRCAHRGTQLSVGSVEGECIRCFYHGWKYAGSGQCVEQPAEGQSFADKVRIPGYPVKDYIGLIFAYVGEREPPPLPRNPKFESPDISLDVAGLRRICNYFNNIDNSLDNVHVRFVHQRHRDSVDDHVVLGDPVPFTLFVVDPVNQQLKSIDPTDGRALDLLNQWGWLHWFRTLASGVSFVLCLVGLGGWPASLFGRSDRQAMRHGR